MRVSLARYLLTGPARAESGGIFQAPGQTPSAGKQQTCSEPFLGQKEIRISWVRTV
jgi:hypothetical protein